MTKAKIVDSFMIVLALAILMLSVAGCGDENKETISEAHTRILSSHSWNLQNLMVDGVDKTSLYTGMTLSFTPTNYTTTKGSPVWAGSGTWTISDDGATITRDDNVSVTVSSISEDQLKLELVWSKTTFTGGRVESVVGRHIYTFVK